MSAKPEAKPIFRYSYSSKRDGKRYTARVVLYARIEKEGHALLLIAAVGRWPDREDIGALADLCEAKSTPMCTAILLPLEAEADWIAQNLRPEEGLWAA